MKSVRWISNVAVLASLILLGACASAPTPPPGASPPGPGNPELACPLPSNCVNSVGSSGLVPLQYTGTAAQALALLRATMATFPEASVVRSESLALEVIFTTPAGFRDQVDFRIDPRSQRIDYRSRSLSGLFDFGKNRSRMEEFKSRFERQTRP